MAAAKTSKTQDIMTTNPFAAPAQAGAGRDASNVAPQPESKEMVADAFKAKVHEAVSGKPPQSAGRNIIPSVETGVLSRALREIMRTVVPTLANVAAIPLSQILSVLEDIRSKSPGSFFQDHREVELTRAEIARLTPSQRLDYIHTREHFIAQRAKRERK
jgi:hypothetical protein